MDLEQNIKKIEELVAGDKISLAIQLLKDLLVRDNLDFFKSESDSLLSLESRYNRNERSFNLDAVIDREEYLLELNKIKKAIYSIRDKISNNPEALGFEEVSKVDPIVSNADTSESIVEKASKFVVLVLMAVAAVLLIYFIAFHKDKDTQLTGILASGGVVFISLFKQTLDKYLRLRFS